MCTCKSSQELVHTGRSDKKVFDRSCYTRGCVCTHANAHKNTFDIALATKRNLHVCPRRSLVFECLQMRASVCVRACVCVLVCVYNTQYIVHGTCTCVSICSHVCVCVCVCVCMYMYVYMHIYVHAHLCVFVYAYVMCMSLLLFIYRYM